MGWDAYATSRRNDPEFDVASDIVKAICGTVDGLLAEGGLDCSNCAEALKAMTGEPVWTDAPWSHKKVQSLATNMIRRDLDTLHEDEAWAYLSAVAFLAVCSRLNVGIEFSY